MFNNCLLNGSTWLAHDVAVYGPGSYTVFASCAPGRPACVGGTNPITFTVGATQIGVHRLFNIGGVVNLDVVNVWTKNAVFAPSSMWTGACGSNPADRVWDLMSSDANGDGIPMVEGAWAGFSPNFNMLTGFPLLVLFLGV